MEAKYAVRCIGDIPYTDARDYRNCYDLYLPETTGPLPVMVYFYGGGLTKGKRQGQTFPRALAAQGIAVACADYRLIPDVDYPAFIEDAADAVAHVKAHIGAYCTPTKFYVGGHSAGCYLSMMLAFDRHYLADRGIDAAALGGFMLVSGGTTKHFELLARAGEDKRALRIDETCVLWHLQASGAPLFIASSPEDMPTRCDQNRLLVSALRNFGYASPISYYEYPGVIHRMFIRPDPETGEIPIMRDLLGFIDRCEQR